MSPGRQPQQQRWEASEQLRQQGQGVPLPLLLHLRRHPLPQRP